MIQAGKIDLEGRELDVINVKTRNSVILLIKTDSGMLGCGYFDIETANITGDALAVVKGVKTFDEMLNADVVNVSNKGKELGVNEGMTGKEALKKMV